MRLKSSTLCALLSSAFFSCALQSREWAPGLDVPPIRGGFDHTSLSVPDEAREEARQVTQPVFVEAKYRFLLPDGSEAIRTMSKAGSSLVLNDEFAVTAYHVIDAPQTIQYIYLEEQSQIPSLSLELSQGFTEYLMTVGTAERVSVRITVGDVETLGVACPDYSAGTLPNGRYPGPDYALLRLPSSHQLPSLARSPHLRLGDSAVLEPGDFVYAVGYSLMQGRFLSAGEVSNVSDFAENSLLQDFEFTITSPISPGNSGGPAFAVYDGDLHYVGVTVAYFVSGQNMNIAEGITSILDDAEQNYGITVRREASPLPVQYENAIPYDSEGSVQGLFSDEEE
ncbi:trypsin-like peptidase domain-containing protein [Candidatus Woesearchaeota archaeon]|nr:trypsin-like peptidase domain-containing protein [Candidatus Woesearchaeota archaeon]